MQPQEAPAEQAPQEEGGDGQMGKMINMIGQGLTMLTEGLQKAGAPEQVVAPFGAALQAFTQGVQALQGGGGGEQQAQQPAPMEGGGRGVPANQNMRG